MNTLKNVFGWALVAYVGFFFVWLMLGMGCMETGRSATECRDNTMSQVAVAIYPFVK